MNMFFLDPLVTRWSTCLNFLFLPVKRGVSAASFLAKASTSILESNFRCLKCTLKMDALPFMSGGPAEKTKQAFREFNIRCVLGH